jgi:hypothetical protein
MKTRVNVFTYSYVEKLKHAPQSVFKYKNFWLSYIRLTKELLIQSRTTINASLKTEGIINKIVDLYMISCKRRNMIFCSCIDIFKYLANESIDEILTFIKEEYSDSLDTKFERIGRNYIKKQTIPPLMSQASQDSNGTQNLFFEKKFSSEFDDAKFFKSSILPGEGLDLDFMRQAPLDTRPSNQPFDDGDPNDFKNLGLDSRLGYNKAPPNVGILPTRMEDSIQYPLGANQVNMKILLDAPDSDMTSFSVSESYGIASEHGPDIRANSSLKAESINSAPQLTTQIINTAYEPESDNNFSSESEGDFVVNLQKLKKTIRVQKKEDRLMTAMKTRIQKTF